MTDTEKAINNFLQEKGIEYSCAYVGSGKPFGNYEMDSWKCTFSHNGKSATFDFHTGIGNRKIKKGAVRPKNYLDDVIGRKSKMMARWEKDNMLPSAPCAAGVLYCLSRDSTARDMCFQDWVDDLGYSADSIKALNTYNECCNIAIKLHSVIGRGNIAILEDMLQDY